MTRKAKLLIALGLVELVALPIMLRNGASAPPILPVQRPSQEPAYVSGTVLVRYRTSSSPSQIVADEESARARLVGTIPGLGIRVLDVSKQESAALRSLSARPEVDFAEPEGLAHESGVTPSAYWWPRQWSPVKTRAPAAWALTTGSSRVVIAVLDTGVDFSHPDLRSEFEPGYDAISPSTRPEDDNGHGTAVAGIIGADGSNRIGVAGYCWACTMLPVKVLDRTGSGGYAVVAAGIVWAVDHGARVITLGLVGSAPSRSLQAAVDYAHARDAVLVAASGNYGSTAPTYPASCKGVISVAGTDPSDDLYSWSNRGSWITLAAPGTNYTTVSPDRYAAFGGTSSAAAAVAGIAGLAFSLRPDVTNLQVERAMETSAVGIGPGVGFGRVDALGTLTALTGKPTGPSAPPGATPAAPSPGAGPPPGAPPTPTSAPPPANTFAFRGVITPKSQTASFDVRCGAGDLSATLSFDRATMLTLELDNGGGSVLARTSGGSPVTVKAVVGAGEYRLVVSGTPKIPFSLSVTCSAA